MRSTRVMHAPFGEITLEQEDGCLTKLSFGRVGELPGGENEAPLPEAERQLREYFEGKRTAFDVPLRPKGTDFQTRVWAALRDIPYGETRSYKQIAEAAGCPRGYRAVGMANHNNPISIIVPCHRVIGASGALTGFGGGLDVKEWLLALERNK